jgi:hypothetical protein
MNLRSIMVGATCALVAGGSVAGAQTSHIFGDGGKVYQFDAECHRVTFAPPGISNHEAINVVGQQVWCLVRRPDPFARCVRHLGPTPQVSIWRKDDWKGIHALRDYVAALGDCSKAHL